LSQSAVTAAPPVSPAIPEEDVVASLPRNSLSSLLAFLIPVAVALVSTPYIVYGLGEERFGIYMVTLSLVSFGGLLDLGFATAAVRFVAEARARGDAQQLSEVINSTLISRLPLLAVLMSVGVPLAPVLVDRVLAISGPLRLDAIFVLRVALVSLGLSMLGGTLAALPRAAQRYDLSSRLGLVFGLLLTGLTVVILALGGGLRQIAVLELALTVAQMAVAWYVARHVMPAWRPAWRLDPARLRSIAAFGAFVALNSVTAIIFIHVNRLLVARLLGVAAVTYFVVPWSLSSRISQVVASLTEAISPVASALSASAEKDRLRELCLAGARFSFAIAGTLGLAVALGAADLLSLWMGPRFAAESAPLLRLLAVMGGLQALSALPYFVLNGVGRSAAANVPVVLGAVLSFPVSLFLLRRIGLPGIGWGLVLAVLVHLMFLFPALGRAVPGGNAWSGGRLGKALAAFAIGLGAGVLLNRALSPGALRLVVICVVAPSLFHGVLLALSFYERSDLERIRRSWLRLRSARMEAA
jgi:O-antigen/teichoic acid export membrane protein